MLFLVHFTWGGKNSSVLDKSRRYNQRRRMQGESFAAAGSFKILQYLSSC